MEAAIDSLKHDAESCVAPDACPALITEHVRSLMDWDNPGADPIWLQFMPDRRELDDSGLPEDGLGELEQSPHPRIIHKYPDRAVLLATGGCFVHCRFCFRRRLWMHGPSLHEISDAELDSVCEFLKRTPAIKDLLISGGDPLTLDDDRLLETVSRLASTGTLDTMRICSRAPSVEPSRISPRLAKGLAESGGLWFISHFNHPKELCGEARKACATLVSNGVPMLNQTVLLAGVNDDFDTLSELFRGLAKLRVKPHYLFHADPVAGTSHFATGIEKGLDIMRRFRRELPSIATPTFAIDLPEGGGKVPLLPDYSSGAAYEAIDGRPLLHPLTGKGTRHG